MNSKIEDLIARLNKLQHHQQETDDEIKSIWNELAVLKKEEYRQTPPQAETFKPSAEAPIQKDFPKKEPSQPPESKIPLPLVNKPPQASTIKTPLEEFIGTNLLNKVGIAILVIGIGFGVKYSIDHQLLNPLTRIILGYGIGTTLVILAVRLKANYHNFSAVLLAGGMAAMYFVTFAAYSFYELVPQSVAFVIMVLFTGFTVFASLHYNLQVIAVVGLVGAYGVPFLLSDNSGRVLILYSYMAIINGGILFLSFRKYWKALYYLAFSLTWLIYSSWFIASYDHERHLSIALVFATLFFITFYVSLLAYKLIRKEPFGIWDIILLVANTFFYFGFGYDSIDSHPDGRNFLGLFTVFNAVLHFMVCLTIYKRQAEYRDIFFFVAGLVLVFLTLSVPVQLEGQWVTLTWVLEACLLFWIGRTKKFTVYELLSYPLFFLSFISLVQDWNTFYSGGPVTTFLNIQFLSSMICIAAYTFVTWLQERKQFPSPFSGKSWGPWLSYIPLALMFITLYMSFYVEVSNYWDQKYLSSSVLMTQENYTYPIYDSDLLLFKKVWLIIYSGIFALSFSLLGLRVFRQNSMKISAILLNLAVIVIFLLAGLDALGDLRASLLQQANANYYFRGAGHGLIRYACLAPIVPLLVVTPRLIREINADKAVTPAVLVFSHVASLAIISSELIHWLEMGGVTDSQRLALSILWGLYAIGLIGYGIWKHNKYLRITGIGLFGITVVKLFFYDLREMSTISKTIVMIILGALLLAASFLYNKYKNELKNTDGEK